MKTLLIAFKTTVVVAMISVIYAMVMAGLFDMVYMIFRMIFLGMLLNLARKDYTRFSFPFIMTILFSFIIALIPGISKYDSESEINYQFRLTDMFVPLLLGCYFIYLTVKNKHSKQSAFIFMIISLLLTAYYSYNLYLMHQDEVIYLSMFENVFFLIRSRVALPFTKYLMFTAIGLRTLIDLEQAPPDKKTFKSKNKYTHSKKGR
ncbi:MAG: hypothetical protein RBQ70_00435 [Acholeplasma sp.]|nr:hypothetical protein [Acholeplasma sp.]